MSDDTTATITLTIPQELKDQLEQSASEQDRSVSSLVRILLRDALDQVAAK
jgi:Arc/MetJ-type ribon-helix-helix transcriptional regulator